MYKRQSSAASAIIVVTLSEILSWIERSAASFKPVSGKSTKVKEQPLIEDKYSPGQPAPAPISIKDDRGERPNF